MYVAVAALTEVETLRFVLAHVTPDGPEFEPARQQVALALVAYFRTRDVQCLSAAVEVARL